MSLEKRLQLQILPYLVVVACFSISLGTAVLTLVMGIMVIAWLASGHWHEKWHNVKTIPAALIAIGLFGLYGLGLLYSNVSWHDKLSWWFKYHKLLYIPLIVSIGLQEKMRRYAINAFLICSLVILCISYLKWLGAVPFQDGGQGYIVFRNRIAQNIFMAFAVFLMLKNAQSKSGTHRYTWLLLSALALWNIFVMVNGRTGQVIVLLLIAFLAYKTWGKKILLGLLGAGLLAGIFHQHLPDTRLTSIRQEIAAHHADGFQTSAGERMEFYKNALILIREHPILGGGTGSFGQSYAALAATQNTILTHVPNPHNQFLLTTQELGIVGLTVLIAFWALQIQASCRLNAPEYQLIFQAIIITIITGSLFNSLFLDAGEGRFYCILAGVMLSAYQAHPTRKPIQTSS